MLIAYCTMVNNDDKVPARMKKNPPYSSIFMMGSALHRHVYPLENVT